LGRALELFTAQGDRRGQMSCVIALAYLAWAPGIHVGSNPAQHIEEIRRLATRLDSISKESFGSAADAQMLFAVHVFARSKGIPALAIARGREGWDAARSAGDRELEFLLAGGTACVYRDLGDLDAMDEWLACAASTATASPTAFRSWQLDVWRAQAAA